MFKKIALALSAAGLVAIPATSADARHHRSYGYSSYGYSYPSYGYSRYGYSYPSYGYSSYGYSNHRSLPPCVRKHHRNGVVYYTRVC